MEQRDETQNAGPAKRSRVKKKGSRKKTKAKKSTSLVAKRARKSPSEPTAKRAAKLAINLVDFEKTTFDSAAKLLGSLNEQSEKAIRHALTNASWMPKEGQKLVEEWQRTVRHSLNDFTKSVDKSFDLLGKYLARVQAEAAKDKN